MYKFHQFSLAHVLLTSLLVVLLVNAYRHELLLRRAQDYAVETRAVTGGLAFRASRLETRHLDGVNLQMLTGRTISLVEEVRVLQSEVGVLRLELERFNKMLKLAPQEKTQ